MRTLKEEVENLSGISADIIVCMGKVQEFSDLVATEYGSNKEFLELMHALNSKVANLNAAVCEVYHIVITEGGET